MKKLRNYNLLIILAIVFVDLFGASMVQTILPGLFASKTGLFTSSTGEIASNILYGALIAAYPLAQLFGAPIFGFLSDAHGRKVVLKWSIIGTAFSYLLFIIGLNIASLPVLFLARLIDGFTGGNILIAQLAIIDSSETKNRTRNLAYINAASGLGVIFGPVFGGVFAEILLVGSRLASPYFIALIFSIINIVLISYLFIETNHEKKTNSRLHVFYSFTQIYNAVREKSLRLMFLVSFLSVSAFSLFYTFFPKLLTDSFQFTPLRLGALSTYTGIWVGIAILAILPLMERRMSNTRLLLNCLLLAGVSLAFLVIPDNYNWFYLILPIVAIGVAISPPVIIAKLSESVSNDRQGEVQGVNGSIQAFASLTPILGGFFVNLWIGAPLVLAALFNIAGAGVIYYWYIRRPSNPAQG